MAATARVLLALATGLVTCAGFSPQLSPSSLSYLASSSSSSSSSSRLHVSFKNAPWGFESRLRPGGRQGRAAPLRLEMQQKLSREERLQTGVSNAQYKKVPAKRIRNFSIIAHIDHGKSTLADRLLEFTRTVPDRELQQQFLDNMDIERERGITIKLQTARMNYNYNGEDYVLNLIDTPGHVDFSYEVSRSLIACESALLVVDASQGIEAQTLANVYLALDADLTIIPVLNKIDLPGADPEKVKREIEEVIGLDTTDSVLCSAKAGIGIEDILKTLIEKTPPPLAREEEPLRCLIFDSYYDPYRGVVTYFRIKSGRIQKGDKIRFMNTGKSFLAEEIGVLAPTQQPTDTLEAGEVGYLIAGIKTVEDARVGDTITHEAENRRAPDALPGYAEAKPMVWSGLFPTDAADYDTLRDALSKLKLNDAALQFEPENSAAMGFGFRCGFLGLAAHGRRAGRGPSLSACTRLEREFDLDLICTAPSVVYQVKPMKGEAYFLSNPSELPEPTKREWIAEPYARLEMITPDEYVGPLMELAQNRRGVYKDMKYLVEGRTTIVYEMPLAEMVTDFFDHLKSRSKGYASMEYSLIEYRQNDLVRLDVAVNGEPVDALSFILHRDNAHGIGKELCLKLKEIIPRQMFKVCWLSAMVETSRGRRNCSRNRLRARSA
ncbi:hypothetical protein GUITHDRAFT_165300 [Guillardia theta CCMP2712]|uniref:Translation factor GUF1 homolog, mitochondrial n=1 Tax=Guillardia theta (strain CCMP2712) TaxID=905079 RepID=L1INZ4_GUITC|nr:hypothetical protein GUITHDRAFT_165300 [Guillardia theta CCMP2712]EKX38011.1 hypothetical protein GUITHDRAFT_165300 [Guillardia theta CCMP2712]|eukprot:XP_005824991.1 hypothetical protein GUITHDRAFT_165300 [Guillardia theta CCMP2712]